MSQQQNALVASLRGQYRFMPGGYPYSSGVVADPGFEVVHVRLRQPVPYREGFERIERHLGSVGRERAALCGIELRSPAPYTRAGFAEFNREYRPLLEEWDLLVDGQNPIARTNVAPQWCAPAEPVLFGFSYTAPTDVTGTTFVVAGGGELRRGTLEEAPVVRPGETSPDAMREKASYVMHVMGKRLAALGVGWADVTQIDVYTAQPFHEWVGPIILGAAGPAALGGLHWYPSRPPIDELEFEMDVRGVRTEILI